MTGKRVLGILAAAALASLPVACERRDLPRNVVLISVDTMRADHLGLYGYSRATTPNLDRWFGSSARIHSRCYAAEASTTPSVVSMLTGLLPQQHRVRMLVQLVPAELKLLPDLLPANWQKAAFVSNMMLTQEASGIGSHFDHYDDFVDEHELYREDTFERNASKTTTAVLDWLASSPTAKAARDAARIQGRDQNKPLFLWIHYMDPHGPYHPPADWKRSFRHDSPLPIDVSRILAYQREPGVDDGLAYVDAYDEELAYVDSEVGRLLAGIDAALGLDSSLVIFSADHGESMMDHETWFRHAVQVYDEMVRVPLMVRGPGVVPGRSDLLTSGMDIVPTVLAALGLPIPAPVADIDLRSDKGLGASRIVFTEASLSARDGDEQWRAAIQADRKWMIGVRRGNCETTRRIFDLARDPDELTIKQWNGEGEAPTALLRLCREDPDPAGIPTAWSFGTGLRGPKSPPMSGEEQMKSLKALGYAE